MSPLSRCAAIPCSIRFFDPLVGALQERLYAGINSRYPMFSTSLEEARAVDPDLVDEMFEMSLRWLVNGFGDSVIDKIVDGYAWFTMHVNRAQLEYERTGAYQSSSFADVNEHVYQQDEVMRRYYWGVYAILFCWPHYVDVLRNYLRVFVPLLPSGEVLEVGPGHGVWGLMALATREDVTLKGLDVSPQSVATASRIAIGAGLEKRSSYVVGDASRDLDDLPLFNSAVSCFVLEHLERPSDFLKHLACAVHDGAPCFVTLALTAGQIDHIYEFVEGDEAIGMASDAGFQLVESFVTGPRRVRPGATRIPRVQALRLVHAR